MRLAAISTQLSVMKTESRSTASQAPSLPQFINPSNPPRPSLPQQSLWLPHGSSCPSPEQRPQSPTWHDDIVLGLLAIIFVLVLIVVLVAAIVILADRIRTLWRETKCGDAERGGGGRVGSGGLLITSWNRRVRRKRRTRTTT